MKLFFRLNWIFMMVFAGMAACGSPDGGGTDVDQVTDDQSVGEADDGETEGGVGSDTATEAEADPGEDDDQAVDDSANTENPEQTDSASSAGGSESEIEEFCDGSVNSCESLNPAQCTAQMGCLTTRFCQGEAAGCTDLVMQDDCEAQSGCVFEGSCIGGKGCNDRESEQACAEDEHCRWKSSCSGEALMCDELEEAGCVDQRGCVLRDLCLGEAVECDAFIAPLACKTQLGCAWSTDDRS